MASSSSSLDLLVAQISINLANTRNTFGPLSRQHQAVLQTLRSCIKEAEAEAQRKEGLNGGGGRDDVDELRRLLERELNIAAA